MIPPSGRYAPVLGALLLLFLLPVAWHRLEPPRRDPCADPERLREMDRIPGTHGLEEQWNAHDEDLFQWTQVELDGRPKAPGLEGAILRSYQASRLYTRPPRYILGSFEAEQSERTEIRSGGETLLVHTIFDGSYGRNAMASYLFVYDGEPVAHPFWSALVRAPRQVFSGTQPLTLIIAGGPVPREERPEARRRAERFIEAAWRHYRRACLEAVPEPPADVSGSRAG
jgi:hypothetical protein